jgi:CheY-like chemotaxis protein
LAEDDESNFLYLEVLLSSRFEILIADNGAEAVDVLKQNNDISLVLIHLKMPVLNGESITVAIRQMKIGAP